MRARTPLEHGTRGRGYQKGCRCDACREAHRIYCKNRRELKGIKRTAAQVAGEKKYEVKRKAKRQLKKLMPNVVIVGVRVNRLKG